ncbi:ATP-binding protein [Pelagibacteraceae bacterium]|nr:ATP-binding protein [Pelagibacteraceae bacterium]|tara:strand:+ start:58 stop:1098 length:1041 start_codon:yes stop_codon:yes gene_type:complete
MKKNLSQSLNKLPIIIIAIDINKQITFYNNVAKQKFLFIDEMIDINNVIRSTELNKFIEESFSNKKDSKLEFSPSNFTDMYFIGDLTFFDNDYSELIISLTDQSTLKNYEQMRTDFVANVSHELRTPLSSIVGYIETIKNSVNSSSENKLDNYVGKFLDTMEDQAWRMTRLVEDLLLLSKYESDEIQMNFEQINIINLIEGVLDNLQNKINDKNIEVKINNYLSKDDVLGNKDALIQVFINLTDNAIKYSKENSKIEIELNERLEQNINYCEINFRDFGEGISEEHLSRLTERFYRVDKNRSRNQGGTGLGLSIVKHITNKHSGKMKIESQIDKGSTFSVALPIIN